MIACNGFIRFDCIRFSISFIFNETAIQRNLLSPVSTNSESSFLFFYFFFLVSCHRIPSTRRPTGTGVFQVGSRFPPESHFVLPSFRPRCQLAPPLLPMAQLRHSCGPPNTQDPVPIKTGTRSPTVPAVPSFFFGFSFFFTELYLLWFPVFFLSFFANVYLPGCNRPFRDGPFFFIRLVARGKLFRRILLL